MAYRRWMSPECHKHSTFPSLSAYGTLPTPFPPQSSLVQDRSHSLKLLQVWFRHRHPQCLWAMLKAWTIRLQSPMSVLTSNHQKRDVEFEEVLKFIWSHAFCRVCTSTHFSSNFLASHAFGEWHISAGCKGNKSGHVYVALKATSLLFLLLIYRCQKPLHTSLHQRRQLNGRYYHSIEYWLGGKGELRENGVISILKDTKKVSKPIQKGSSARRILSSCKGSPVLVSAWPWHKYSLASRNVGIPTSGFQMYSTIVIPLYYY